jgi:hypothetical protein
MVTVAGIGPDGTKVDPEKGPAVEMAKINEAEEADDPNVVHPARRGRKFETIKEKGRIKLWWAKLKHQWNPPRQGMPSLRRLDLEDDKPTLTTGGLEKARLPQLETDEVIPGEEERKLQVDPEAQSEPSKSKSDVLPSPSLSSGRFLNDSVVPSPTLQARIFQTFKKKKKKRKKRPLTPAPEEPSKEAEAAPAEDSDDEELEEGHVHSKKPRKTPSSLRTRKRAKTPRRRPSPQAKHPRPRPATRSARTQKLPLLVWRSPPSAWETTRGASTCPLTCPHWTPGLLLLTSKHLLLAPGQRAAATVQ